MLGGGALYQPSLWYVGDKAYDLTEFIDQHPGGKWALLLGQGRDCTALLHSYHWNPNGPLALLSRYARPQHDLRQPLPLLRGAQPVSFEAAGFYATVKKAVREEYFAKHGLSHYAPLRQLVLNIALLVLQCVALLLMASASSRMLALLWAVVFGYVRGLNASFGHAAAHFALFRNQKANRVAAFVSNVLTGHATLPLWEVQHNVSHHIYTNDFPLDNDSGFPVKSIFAHQPRLWYHGYQHLYVWLVYLFVLPIRLSGHLQFLASRRYIVWSLASLPAVPWLAYSEVALMLLHYTAPLLWQPSIQTLEAFLLASSVTSLVIGVGFVVNHEVDVVAEAQPQPHDQPQDWGQCQTEQSHTYSPGSAFTNFFTGGLSHQIEHHLFPGVNPAHLPAISAIVRRTAHQFKVRYPSSTSFWHSLQGHYRLLRSPPHDIHKKPCPPSQHSATQDVAASQPAQSHHQPQHSDAIACQPASSPVVQQLAWQPTGFKTASSATPIRSDARQRYVLKSQK